MSVFSISSQIRYVDDNRIPSYWNFYDFYSDLMSMSDRLRKYFYVLNPNEFQRKIKDAADGRIETRRYPPQNTDNYQDLEKIIYSKLSNF